MSGDKTTQKIAWWIFWRVALVLLVFGSLVGGAPGFVAALIADPLSQTYVIVRGFANLIGALLLLALGFYALNHFISEAIGKTFGSFQLQLVPLQEDQKVGQ